MAAAHSRIVVVVVALGLCIAACMAGDHGSARAAVGQGTGPLVGSDRADAAVLVAQGMAPGESRSGVVTVTNAGDAAGAFVLTGTGLADSGARLSSVLGLTVQDVTPGRALSQLYAGPLSGLSGISLGTLAQGEARTYRFTVNVAAGAGNAYQGATTSMSFVWTTTAAATAPTPTPTPVPTPPAKTPAKVLPLPTATLTASAHQTGAKGSVAATVVCQARCQAVLSASALDGEKSLAMRTVRRTILSPAKVRLRIMLPERAKAALKDDRALAVRLRLKATMGTRVLVMRRTVRVAASHR
jgi:spore coat-associated protein N